MTSSTLKLRKVFVEAEDGVPNNEASFKAWDGFRKRKIHCELFSIKQLEQHKLSLSRDTLVAGGLRTVETAMKQIGMPVPTADNLPDVLSKYRGRKVWTSTWGELRARFTSRNPDEPMFVKPLRVNKGFPAIALYTGDDLPPTSKAADRDEVLISEYVLFESEWRCFVCRREIIGMCPYQGDVFKFPDADLIRSAISDFGKNAPAGYGIDFGVLAAGPTVLVEVNDGYALGSFSLNSVEYSELLEARWMQIAAGLD